MHGKRRIDTTLVFIIGALVIGGAFLFASAAFGLVARGQAGMTSIVFNHLVLGIGLGLLALGIGVKVDYRAWKRFAPYIFGVALVATLLVFVPHVGVAHLGGRRWVEIGGVSFQPSEALKVGIVLIAAAYFSSLHARVGETRYGLLGFIAILGAPALVLVAQPDLGTLGVVAISALAVFFAAGARWRDIALVIVVALLGVAALAFLRPYVLDRVTTFLHPSQSRLGEGYQIRQSLIAIGSGGIVGRGFGQGIQKFTYLPEPMGDSIFAVAGEELGFVGATGIIIAFLALALRGYRVASRAPDMFGALVGVGISTYLASEAFINIAAMLGVAPLTGIPLTFISQGGSAMLVSLGSAGVLLNISKAGGGRRE